MSLNRDEKEFLTQIAGAIVQHNNSFLKKIDERFDYLKSQNEQLRNEISKLRTESVVRHDVLVGGTITGKTIAFWKLAGKFFKPDQKPTKKLLTVPDNAL